MWARHTHLSASNPPYFFNAGTGTPGGYLRTSTLIFFTSHAAHGYPVFIRVHGRILFPRALKKLPTAGGRTNSADLPDTVRLDKDIGKGMGEIFMALARGVKFRDGEDPMMVLASTMRHCKPLRDAATDALADLETTPTQRLLRVLARAWHGNMIQGNKETALSILSIAVCIPGPHAGTWVKESTVLSEFMSESVPLHKNNTVLVCQFRNYAGSETKQRRYWAQQIYKHGNRRKLMHEAVIVSIDHEAKNATLRYSVAMGDGDTRRTVVPLTDVMRPFHHRLNGHQLRKAKALAQDRFPGSAPPPKLKRIVARLTELQFIHRV